MFSSHQFIVYFFSQVISCNFYCDSYVYSQESSPALIGFLNSIFLQVNSSSTNILQVKVLLSSWSSLYFLLVSIWKRSWAFHA